MGTTTTTIPSLTPNNFAARMAATYPAGWSSSDAISPGGVLYGIMLMIGSPLNFEITAEQYALGATRIDTATNGALDLASLDYFGTGLYTLPRQLGESDASFSLRMGPWPLGAMLQPYATRSAVIAAVKAVTGFAPRTVEPWCPGDTGAWDHFYWDVDTAEAPFRWTSSAIPTDLNLAYQAFMDCVLPTPALLGGNPVPCFDNNFYWDTAGSSLIDMDPSVPLGPQVVYDAINRAKCEGTIVWVRFVNAPTTYSWDQPGVTWDQPGATWA